MVRLRTGASIIAAMVLTLSLAGCFEITKDAAFREDGGARVEIEMGLSAAFATLLKNPVFAKQMAQEGAPDLFADCGKPWPAGKPIPAGMRSVESRRGKRADLETCTFVIDVSDPVAAAVSSKEMPPPAGDKMPTHSLSLVRLAGRPGYRLRFAVNPLRPPRARQDSRNAGKAVLDALFANRHLTLSISARRIENTNGELTPDGRRVTWRFPIASVIDPGRPAPLTFEADVIYK